MSLILASRSPRRRELLEQIGLSFRVMPADIDESVRGGESAPAFVERMALEKGRAVAAGEPDAVVIGSDTAVVLDDHIMGKPRDRAHAAGMLSHLSGRTHQVLSSVAVIHAGGEAVRLSTSEVRFRPITPDEATAYWASGEPADKAGGYAIQGLGAVFVENLNGSYSGVMGLPLFETAQLLTEAGLQLPGSGRSGLQG